MGRDSSASYRDEGKVSEGGSAMTVNLTHTLTVATLLAAQFAVGAEPDAVAPYSASFIEQNRIPGLSLAVVHYGRVVKAAGYGYANLELKAPATADTAYEIGSITKSFTAQALMLLVEQGRLALDDT